MMRLKIVQPRLKLPTRGKKELDLMVARSKVDQSSASADELKLKKSICGRHPQRKRTRLVWSIQRPQRLPLPRNVMERKEDRPHHHHLVCLRLTMTNCLAQLCLTQRRFLLPFNNAVLQRKQPEQRKPCQRLQAEHELQRYGERKYSEVLPSQKSRPIRCERRLGQSER